MAEKAPQKIGILRRFLFASSEDGRTQNENPPQSNIEAAIRRAGDGTAAEQQHGRTNNHSSPTQAAILMQCAAQTARGDTASAEQLGRDAHSAGGLGDADTLEAFGLIGVCGADARGRQQRQTRCSRKKKKQPPQQSRATTSTLKIFLEKLFLNFLLLF